MKSSCVLYQQLQRAAPLGLMSYTEIAEIVAPYDIHISPPKLHKRARYLEIMHRRVVLLILRLFEERLQLLVHRFRHEGRERCHGLTQRVQHFEQRVQCLHSHFKLLRSGTDFLVAGASGVTCVKRVQKVFTLRQSSRPVAPFMRLRLRRTYQLVSCSTKRTRRGTTV